MKALAAGVPLVCIPMGRDQNDTAARVVHAGAGVRLRPGTSVSRVRRAVRRVLGDDRFRIGAEQMATTIRQGRLTADLVTEIEAAVAASPTTSTGGHRRHRRHPEPNGCGRSDPRAPAAGARSAEDQPASSLTLAMRSTGRWSPTGIGVTCRWVTPAAP